MNEKTGARSWWFGFAVILAGCSGGDPVNLGDDTPELTGERLSDYSAVWEGYVEAYQFPSGSDRVRLTLDAEGNGAITFGEGTPLPQSAELSFDGYFAPYAMPEGSPLAVTAAEVSERRLRLSYDLLAPFRGWCEAQPSYDLPYEQGFGSHACLPGYSGGSHADGSCYYYAATPEEEAVSADCASVYLCLLDWAYKGPICACDAESCAAKQENVVFDGALEDAGDRLVGTTTIDFHDDDGTRVTLRLTRVH